MHKDVLKPQFDLILIGPQGSGKGTQAALLKQKYHFHPISTGDIARSLAKGKSALSNEVRSLMNEGKLLPDSIINHGVTDVVSRHSHMNFLFDGYPRTIKQAEFIYEHLLSKKRSVMVISLELDHATSIERIKNRFMCESCGSIIYPKSTIFHGILRKFRQIKRRCPHCGGKLVQRSDDTEDAIKERLKIYQTETKPVIHFFQSKNILRTVDAKPSIPEVTKAIDVIIDAGVQ